MTIVAVTVSLAHRLRVEIPLQIVDDDQIEQAVIVHVDPRGRYGPKRTILRVRLVESGFGGHVGESSVAVVVIKRIGIPPRDKNVFVTVVVVVTDRNTHVVAASSQPGLFGYIGEVSFTVVLEEAVGVFRGILAERFDVGSIGKENVELAVVVVVEDADASCHRLRRMALGCFAAVEFEINWLVGKLNRAVSRGVGRGVSCFLRSTGLRMEWRLRACENKRGKYCYRPGELTNLHLRGGMECLPSSYFSGRSSVTGRAAIGRRITPAISVHHQSKYEPQHAPPSCRVVLRPR